MAQQKYSGVTTAHNNCINADRFYTPRRFTLLCVKPSGYAER